MKKLLFAPLLLLAVFFSSCKKEHVDTDVIPAVKPETVRFEFSSDVAANYRLSVFADAEGYDETAYTTSWSKEMPIIASDAAGARTAQFMIFPPEEWMFTTKSAHVTLKIFVRGVEKASKTMELFWVDRPTLFKLAVSY